MVYKLYIPASTERQIDKAIEYVAKTLKNSEAASEILDDIDQTYGFLETDAEDQAYCTDEYLHALGYRMIALRRHNYLFIYRVEDSTVHIVGFCHMLENYIEKLSDI